MLILVDMDGTLADLEGRFLEQYRALFPKNPALDPETLPWNVPAILPEADRGAFWNILSKEGFFAGLDPLPGAIEAFHAMRAEGHDVVVCTSPLISSRWCESEKRHWVEERLGREFTRDMVIAHDKTLVIGDVLIDDRPEIRGRRAPVWRHVLLDRSYNRDIGLPRIARDWSDWREVLAAL